MAAVATMPGLRPLGFGEILDVGIKLYLRNWRPLILCVVGLVLPVQIVSVLLLLSVSPDLLDPTATSPDLESEDASALLAAQGVSALLQGIVYVIATAACFKAVSDAYLGSTPSAGRSLRFAVRALPRLLLLGLVYVLFVGVVVGVFVLLALISPIVLAIAIVAAIVPVIYLSVALTLTVPALLFERASPVKALGRSYRLVKGRWWSICGIIIVGVMLVSFIAGILQAVIQIVPALLADGNEAVLAFSTVVAGTVSSALTTPYTAAVIALIYFDQRVRKEGFDLEILAQGLGESFDPDADPAVRRTSSRRSRPSSAPPRRSGRRPRAGSRRSRRRRAPAAGRTPRQRSRPPRRSPRPTRRRRRRARIRRARGSRRARPRGHPSRPSAAPAVCDGAPGGAARRRRPRGRPGARVGGGRDRRGAARARRRAPRATPPRSSA